MTIGAVMNVLSSLCTYLLSARIVEREQGTGERPPSKGLNAGYVNKRGGRGNRAEANLRCCELVCMSAFHLKFMNRSLFLICEICIFRNTRPDFVIVLLRSDSFTKLNWLVRVHYKFMLKRIRKLCLIFFQMRSCEF